MATGTAGGTARHGIQQVVRIIRKDFTYANDGTTLVIGKIPAGSVIIKAASGVQVSTAFNGNATNTLDVGYSDDTGTDNLATLLSLATATFVPLDEAVGDFYTGTSDRTISMKVTSTAAASAGVGQAFICFIENIGP